MRNPWSRYENWLIVKSLAIEMRGGTWNGIKALSLLIGGAILPIMAVILAVDYFVPVIH